MKSAAARKILLVVSAAVFLFSTAMVLKHRLEMKASAEYTETLVKMAVRSVVPQPENERAEESVSETAEVAPIRVDFDALCAQNPDIVAWIYCPDTPINYPVVQAADNEYYVHRLVDGSKNAAGTLFMDCRNAAELSDWNSVIYGHNMSNTSMFGTLMDYKSQAYFDAHPRLFLLTPNGDYAINVAAGFVTPADAALYNAFNPSAEERKSLVESWMRVSRFVSGIVPTAEDRLVTLSTCSYEYNDARYVVVGVLEELGVRQK